MSDHDDELPMDSAIWEEVHIAGTSVQIDGQYVRQRCAWCGAVLIDHTFSEPGEYDTAAIVFPDDSVVGRESSDHPWTLLVGVDDDLPDSSCTAIDPSVTL